MIGTRIAHYQVLDKLGEGGMGIVYLARDLTLNRLVALKFPPPQRAADPEFQMRFVSEAQAASALNHPHIVTIYGMETAEGVSIIAMEYIAGSTLDKLIGARGLPIGTVLRYAIQIAEALSAAHASGIVHRDVKPRNIALTDREQIKILDFGLAKLTRSAAATSSVTMSIYDERKIAGTIAYMSPEQVEGKKLDTRTDVFSFGVTLYEMLTGCQPFLRETEAETVAAILRDDPPLPEGIPPELARLTARCLRKDPERRLRHLDDAKLILDEIKSELDSGPVSAKETADSRLRTRLRLWRLALVGIFVAIAAAAIVSWFLTRKSAPTPPAMVVIPLTSYLGNEVQPSFSPDGNQIAFAWDGERQDNLDIYVKLIGGSERPLRLTTDTAPDISPAWSSDGRFIAFVRNEPGVKASVLVVPAIGGPARLVCDLGTSFAFPAVHYMVVAPLPLVAWMPDGKSLVFADRNSPREPLGLFVVSLETGEKHRITTAPSGYVGDGAPAIRSDGRAVIFSRAAGLTSSDLYRLELTKELRPDGEPRRLTFTKRWNTSPVWLSKGEIVFTSSNWYLGSAGLMRMAASPNQSPVVLGGMGEDVTFPAVSARTQRLVFSRSVSTQNIWRLPLKTGHTTGRPEKLIASTRTDEAPQYSPDGSKIAFASSRSGAPEIWVCERDGTNPVQLTSLRAPVTGSPHWSPDGKQIVFDSNLEGHFEVYLINAAGGSPRRLTTELANNALASFSRDQRNIYFSSERTGRWEVWKVPVTGGNPVQITSAGGRAPIESPDRRFLYYEKSYDLWRIASDGGKETRVLESVGFLNFAITQNGIYFLRDEEVDPRRAIHFLNTSHPGAILPVYEVGNAIGAGVAVAPDDSSLLFTNVVQRGSDLMLVEHFK